MGPDLHLCNTRPVWTARKAEQQPGRVRRARAPSSLECTPTSCGAAHTPCPPVGRLPPGFRDAQSPADTLPLPWAPEAAAWPRPWGAPGTPLPAAASPAPTAPPSPPPATPLSSPENQRHEMSFSHTWLYFSVTALLFGKQKQFTKTKQKIQRPQNIKHQLQPRASLQKPSVPTHRWARPCLRFSVQSPGASQHPARTPSPGKVGRGARVPVGLSWLGMPLGGESSSLVTRTCDRMPCSTAGTQPEPSEGLTRGPQTKGSKVSVHHQCQG